MRSDRSWILRAVVALVALVSLVGCASFTRAAAMPVTSSSPIASPSTVRRTSTGALYPTGHSGRYVTVGLGDSVPSAANCAGCVSFVTQAGTQIAEKIGRRSVVSNEAVAGYTSTDVLSQLGSASVRSRIADSDLVIITVGANDLADGLTGSCDAESGCIGTRMTQVRNRLTTIVEDVRALQTAPDATVMLTGYWNIGQDGDVGQQNGEDYVTTSRTLTRQFNTMAAGVASAQKVAYADFYTPFVGADGSKDPTGLLAADGDHPDAAGHAKLAAAVVSALGL